MKKGIPEKNGHILEIDYIRAVSAILVVLYHYTTRYQETMNPVSDWAVSIPWGAWAVNTFFLLSGYLTLRNYREGGISFLYKRFARLWPAFAVCVIITTVFMAAMLPERLRSVTDILLNFCMAPNFFGAEAVDGAYWTLPVELLFYFWIMVCMLPKLQPHLLKTLYGWMILAVTVSVLTSMGISAFPLKAARILLITERGHCFIMGAVIALWQRYEWKRLLPLLGLCVVNSLINLGLAVTVWTVVFAVLILCVAVGKLKLPAMEHNQVGKCLIFLSGISYPLYLLHQNIGFAVIRWLEGAGFTSQIWILVPVALSVGLAAMVHYWVEIPAGRFLLELEKKLAPWRKLK